MEEQNKIEIVCKLYDMLFENSINLSKFITALDSLKNLCRVLNVSMKSVHTLHLLHNHDIKLKRSKYFTIDNDYFSD
jgi:hypothetical protein